jgi:hypothetical protein
VSDSPPATSLIVVIILAIGVFVGAVLLMENGKKIKQ